MKAEEKVLTLLGWLHQRKIADPNDPNLQDELDGLSAKQILRDLRSLSKHFDTLVEEKEGKRIVFHLIEPIDLFVKMHEKDVGLGVLFEMAREGMPDLIDELDGINRREHKPYLFFNMPFEEITQLEDEPKFRSIRDAITRHEYRTIILKGGKRFDDVKPIRLLFSEGNWYVAYLDDRQLRLSRISFIDAVHYGKGATYLPSSIAGALQWLEQRYQNPFSRYNKPVHTAILLARPAIAHYFDEGMKPFFRTQRFISRGEDGVRFGVEYTKQMEILPFIQRWLPDLEIVSPPELREALRTKLTEALAQLEPTPPAETTH